MELIGAEESIKLDVDRIGLDRIEFFGSVDSSDSIYPKGCMLSNDVGAVRVPSM